MTKAEIKADDEAAKLAEREAEMAKAKAASEAADKAAEEEQAKAAAAAAELAVLQRRKVGRGSTRRITRAKDTLDQALIAFRKEMGLEVYQVDDEGARNGDWPALKEIDRFRVWITEQIGEILK